LPRPALVRSSRRQAGTPDCRAVEVDTDRERADGHAYLQGPVPIPEVHYGDRDWPPYVSTVQIHQVELFQMSGIGDCVDAADLAIRDRDLQYHLWLAARGPNRSRYPIDQDQSCRSCQAVEGFRYVPRAVDHRDAANARRRRIGAELDVRIQHLEQSGEVALTGCPQECRYHLALLVLIESGWRV